MKPATIFDITGKEIGNYKKEWLQQGENSIEWNAYNKQGERVVPGIYFYKLQIDSQMVAGKLFFIGK